MYSVPNPLSALTASNYGSAVNTRAPFDAGKMRTMSASPSPTGRSAGANAALRGMADMNRSQTQRGLQDFNRNFRQEAEQARSADVLAMRQDALRNYQLQKQNSLTGMQLDQKRTQGMADLANEMRIARERQKQANINGMIDLGMSAALFAANPMLGAGNLIYKLSSPKV